MFENIGRKIKFLVKLLFALELFVILVVGIYTAEYTYGISLLIALLAILIAWITTWLIYGYGEIVDKLCDIERNTRCLTGKSGISDEERLERIKRFQLLYSKGLITEEEYQRAMSKYR